MDTMVLLDLMGGVALLLWGLHMLRSGIMRAFGSDLRRVLGQALRNRLIAFAAGLGITAVLQSSTATNLMTTSLVTRGILGLVPGLAIVLGANVGTTLIVQVLSLNVSAASSVLFLIGVVAFNRGRRTWVRDAGRALIGLGLMLLALHILLDTLSPAENAAGVHELVSVITREPVLCVLFAAALAWAAHSSAAIVLLTMSLAYSHFITPVAGLALVLGANLGAAVNPLLESGGAENPAARRLPIGNMINRCVGIALVLPFLHPISEFMARIDANPVRAVADFHTLFNVVLAIVFMLVLDQFAWLLIRILPDRKPAADPSTPLYLDDATIGGPTVALASAARETLHMGDVIEEMLRKAMRVLLTDDRRLMAEVSRMDNVADRLHEAIKIYVTNLTRESLDEQDGLRAMEIIAFAINLEHIGDIIDKNLMELAAKKIKHKYQFSKEGAQELETFHARVVNNLKLAFSIFMSGDVKLARRLIEDKAAIRREELTAAENHLRRLREGRPESIETSSLHLDVLRDLKRIHSHICAVAYPALEAAGELHSSRLKENEPETVEINKVSGT
jgi:phosphate:Na+ symporter